MRLLHYLRYKIHSARSRSIRSRAAREYRKELLLAYKADRMARKAYLLSSGVFYKAWKNPSNNTTPEPDRPRGQGVSLSGIRSVLSRVVIIEQ